jgi:bacteriocin-like protein
MAHIQMTDSNPSDLGIMEEVEELTSEELLDEELTDEELQAIDGGALGATTGAIGGAGFSIATDIYNGERIDWSYAADSAGKGAVSGAIRGGIGGAGIIGPWGGLAGASLAGED